MARRRKGGLVGAVVPLAVCATVIFNPWGIRDAATTWYVQRWQERAELQPEPVKEQQQRLEQVPTAPVAPSASPTTP